MSAAGHSATSKLSDTRRLVFYERGESRKNFSPAGSVIVSAPASPRLTRQLINAAHAVVYQVPQPRLFLSGLRCEK